MCKLLSDNDWNGITVAHRKQKEFRLTRTMGKVAVEVCTSPAPPVWDVPMLVGIVRMYNGEIVERQWHTSAQAARAAVEGWRV